MNEKQTILVVDDEPMNREILEEILELDYVVALAESGPECLEVVGNVHPHAILLDINMPGMSGYEVCDLLKKSSETAAIPVTFVSALDTLAERLAGYEVGADDYITKPFEARELLSKVKIIINNQKRQQELSSNVIHASQTAMAAMTSSEELGDVVKFIRESFSCDDLEVLAKHAVDSLSKFGLRSVVQIRLKDGAINQSSDGMVNPLESTIISRIYKENRIIDMGPRTVFNYPHVSILAKGMPLDDEDKCARYKDHLALLADSLEERVKAIIVQSQLTNKQTALTNIAEQTQKAMSDVAATHEQHKNESTIILKELLTNAEKSFSSLDLSEAEEDSFMEMIDTAVTKTLELYNQGINIEGALTNVVNEAQQALIKYE